MQELVTGADVDQEHQHIRFDAASVRMAVDELKRRGLFAFYIKRAAFLEIGYSHLLICHR